ncbi:hypothetical protein RUM44_009644 [Polyplax serrata]|uniref:Uncharacterized protein n=1 Tax=Polyplax serrata TaxID=468196 RepID=A0ABR1AUZ8_POLSC
MAVTFGFKTKLSIIWNQNEKKKNISIASKSPAVQTHKSTYEYQEEDKDLEAQVLSKGLRLTPIRKHEYQSAV